MTISLICAGDSHACPGLVPAIFYFFQWILCKYLKQTQLPNSPPRLSTLSSLLLKIAPHPTPHSLDSTLQSHLWLLLSYPHLISNGAGQISPAPYLLPRSQLKFLSKPFYLSGSSQKNKPHYFFLKRENNSRNWLNGY